MHGPMATRSLLLVIAIAVLAFAAPVEGEVDLQALSLTYSFTDDAEGATMLVASGRDNATLYRYLILDDISEAPENWSQPGFDDSGWVLAPAPFAW